MRNNFRYFYGNSAERIDDVDSRVLPRRTVCINDSNAITNYKGITGQDNVYVGEVNQGVKQR